MSARGLCSLVESLVRELARLAPDVLDVDACVALVDVLARAEKACATARVAVGARAASCGAHRVAGYAAPSAWLAAAAGCSSVDAERALTVAERWTELPATRDALVAGELSFAQAHEVAMTVEACGPGAEGELLDLARGSALRDLRDEGRRRRLAAVDVHELHTRQRAARYHRHWRDEYGMIRYAGAMLPEQGVPFVHRVDLETDRVWRRAHRTGETEPRERYAADAFAAVVAGGGKAHPIRADVVYVCEVPNGECHLVGGGPVRPEVVDAAVRAGAFVKAVLHDGTRVDTVAHYGRRIPAVVRTALELGRPPQFDGVECAETGCDHTNGLEWDHVDPLANGGPTALHNLAPRCRPCHAAKTERDRLAGLLGGHARGRGP